jgi:2-oxoglutarate dehydrogenase E2 component (dihydrolipoamide succinyltransferase)
MGIEVRVPALGESIVDAVVARWLKKEGDTVQQDETLVELETDKVNVEVPAPQSGVLQKILHGEGDTVAVGEALASLGADQSVSADQSVGADQPVGQPAATTATAAPAQTTTAKDDAATTDRAEAGNNYGGDPAGPLTAANGQHNLPLATPVAKLVAAEHNVDLSQVKGSSLPGRVTKQDVLGYVQGGAAPAQVAPAPAGQPVAQPAPAPTGQPVAAPAPAQPKAAAPAPAPAGDKREERVRLSRRRQTIATRLVEAQHNAAMLTTFNEVDMSAIMEVRSRRKEAFKERHQVSLGFMSFFTKAVVGALKAFPVLNAEIQGTDMILKHYYDIGIAVGAEEGLVVPVVRDADRKSFAQIEREISDLAKKARSNSLALSDLQGGTFTITNGGVFGSLLSTPILNAPQVGILGMHKIQERPVAIKGQVVIRPMMYVALSYDHRLVDGSGAVQFLVRVKELLEDPESLLLEG